METPPLLPVIKRRDLTSDKPLQLPVRDEDWSVDRLSWNVIGGPDSAAISTSGKPTALAQLLDLLRCPVEIYDDIARAVWWGFVNEIKITVGNIAIGVSLDKLANKLRVVYTKQTSGVSTGGGRGTTDWAEDAASIAEYGERQLSVSMSDVTFNQADQARDARLAWMKRPKPIRTSGGGGAKRRQQPGREQPKEEEVATATIICKGWWHTLEWKYYSQYPSATSSENEPTTISKVGRSTLTGLADIVFADVGGEWRIEDNLATGRLLGWEEGDYIVITGTSSNNIKTRVLSATEDGNRLVVSDAVDNESPASTTIAPWSSKIAQSFQLTDYGESYWLHTVRLQAMMVGLPDVGSELRVSIAEDDGGEPGAILASAELVADDDIFDVMTWCDWTAWDSIILLDPNTTYWIVVERVDTADTDCYTIALDEEALYAGGKAMFWTGAAWEPFSNSDAVEVPADMPFVLIGAWITEKQIEELIAAAEFITSVTVVDASSSYGFPYRNGDNTILYELKKLLQSGVAGGRRYIATVKRDRSLEVREEPESAGIYDLQLTTDGRYLNHLGEEIEPYRLGDIAGHWVRLPQTILTVLNSAQLTIQSPYFVESIEWTPGSGARDVPLGGSDPWDNSVREG